MTEETEKETSTEGEASGNSELLCCPFCGDKEVYINEQEDEVEDKVYHDFYNVYCPMCCASVDYGEDKGKTIELWNRRETYDEGEAIEQQRVVIEQKITERLLAKYRKRPAAIAMVCDETIDKTGNLLGWLRDLDRLDR